MSSGPEWGQSFAKASTSAMGVYDDIMVPRLFEPWAELLLDELNLRRRQVVLDIACGPGTVTRLAAHRVGSSGRVTGCDMSAAMLELARAKPPIDDGAPIDYLECPADAIPVGDHDFDVVTCQQGLQFFPDRPAALAEMRRVLRPGGRLGVAVWCAIEESPPFAALARALRQVLGTDAAETYRSGPWGYGDADPIVRLVTESGFGDVRARRLERPLTFEGGPDQLMMTLYATAVAGNLAELTADDLAALALAVQDAARPLTSGGVIRSYATSHIVTARLDEYQV